ncbi:peptide chain release factor 1 [Paenibacillus thiaminolyticus]|uniref:Peptide chain release factor 1 n=1 Tax=Paenibacillus thiaminolyticus TaxID=49283 RepID=A0AAJ1LG02_PANTH|nr:peptide chain release factor 1 [Paenibacillus thiaminolyticus]MCY9535148.1 peptide chain release factor 1 [Paenibacillus thiaminolyticus]MCY9602103.1 peptide chain release factor 1 [Paenibacillus thiaminolyticus]MCY9608838.1 peptide chain release factor 1 [Paenibacillus thiaminolyticus]MCY9615002.1 peptide chain release factor 1 [Paenibacillus thiaminolyticus]MCY9618434.1 peptide chain release factor 1 [Paenibacillus thiaminolyticus]
MLDRLQSLADRYDKLSELLCDPDVANDPKKLRDYSKEQSDLQPAYEAYMEYKNVISELDAAKAMLQEKLDDDMREMVKMEIEELEERKVKLEERIRVLLLPKDPNDDKNVIVEIRGAAGGDEAALFAADLYRMYTRYADAQGWRTELMEANISDLGGFKEVIFLVSGKGAYSKLKYESGAHRVQRIPATESGGRIHTSTSTVAVMPEIDEVEVEILDKDIRVDTFCSSGAGGQSVNTTKSAVRVTHIPTGIVATCQDGKSQNDNKAKALQVLRARIFDIKRQEEEAKYAGERKSKVGTGDRSERIRTYNFPQSRVTDHRIGLTMHKLDQVMNGDMEEIIQALTLTEQAELMERENHA